MHPHSKNVNEIVAQIYLPNAISWAFGICSTYPHLDYTSLLISCFSSN